MSDSDTIYALSSAPGPAGVAVVRLSGAQATEMCRAIAGALPQPRRAALRTLKDPGSAEIIDRALVLSFPAPNSFTGEDCVEFQVHGGRAVLDALFQALSGFEAARLAEPGEFTRRAFVNGRMDLTEAEGVADLIAAETAAQRRAALAQADGSLSTLYNGWRERLLRHLAHLEAWLDFPDEDLPQTVLAELRQGIADLDEEISEHLQDGRRGERMRDGVVVALTGPPNAGKSTLLNALAQRDVAIVSDVPGTTRDLLEVHFDLGGYPVILVDMAGLRDSDDMVEQEGVRRAILQMRKADVILRLYPADAQKTEAQDTREDSESDQIVLHILSKADQSDSSLSEDYDLTLSAQTGEGMADLLVRLTGLARDLTEAGSRVLPTRLRHRDGLSETLTHLARASESAELAPELLGENLRLAMRALGRITGSVDVEDLLDVIFRDFCIGK